MFKNIVEKNRETSLCNDVSSETLRSVSNALDVTVSELFESVESHEREIELMEYSQEQQRQLNQRKYEMNAIRLVSVLLQSKKI